MPPRRLLIGFVATIACLVGATSASAVDWPVAPLTPVNGGVYSTDTSNTSFAAELQAPTAVSGGTQTVIELASEPTLGQDGTLANDKQIGFGLLYKRDSDPTKWFGSYSTLLYRTPGTYYFQYSVLVLQSISDTSQSCPGVPIGNPALCTYISPVMSFQVVAPPQPACSDGVDNDGDGQVDLQDWGCTDVNDNFEQLDAAGPLLTVADAKEYARRKLRQRFGTNFSSRTGYAITCGRTLRRQMICQTKWTVGSRRYRGPVRVTLTAIGENVYLSVDVSKVKRQIPSPGKIPSPGNSAGICDPNYTGACLDPDALDYDCVGGSGDGPRYTGTVVVVGNDHFGLDRDGDGIGCE